MFPQFFVQKNIDLLNKKAAWRTFSLEVAFLFGRYFSTTGAFMHNSGGEGKNPSTRAKLSTGQDY